MAKYNISASDLREGQQILVRGEIAFSRLAAPIQGKALEDSIKREEAANAVRVAQGGKRAYPTKVPHTRVNIVNAEVIPATPGALTTEEQYIDERLYLVGSGANAGKKAHSTINKGTKLPPVFEKQADGTYARKTLERDLATGVKVILVLNVFKPKSDEYDNRGVGLAQVLVEEPFRYYSGAGVNTETLAARGIIITGDTKLVDGADLETVDDGQSEQPQIDEEDYYSDEPVSIPQTVVVGTPAAPAPAAPAPAGPSAAEQRAALEAQIAALEARKAADAASGGAIGSSPFDAGATPWEAPGAGISYDG